MFFAQEKLSTYKGQMQAGTYLLVQLTLLHVLWVFLLVMRSRLVLRRIVPQQLIQRPRQILRLQMQELIQLIPRAQMVQRILRQLMELQGRRVRTVIVEERMRTYINSLDMGNTPFLEELEKEALAGRVPIIRKEMQSFLKMFLAATRPMKILEVGTAVGFSTLLMCEYGPENLKITTIENYEKRIPIARANFRKAGRESQIEFLTGDAGEILKELTGTYDLIFMDAAKGQYMNWLPDVLQLMHKGSVLVSDNVLQEGDILLNPIIL